MSAFPTYSTGTVAISADGTTVAGTGSNWTGQNAVAGDTLSVAGFGQVIIASVTDATTLVIDAWPFGAVSAGTTYKIYKNSSSRFVGAQTAVAVDQMVTALNTNGFYVFVGSDETVPDPSLGDDDQYALKATTGQIWQKEGGVWTFVGTFKGFGTPAPWDSSTAYVAFDVVSFEGTSYVCIDANTNETPSSGDSPPNAFWTVLAAQGEAATVEVGTVTTGAGGSDAAVTNSGTTGAAVLDFTIPAGEGYGGTSTTSLAIGTGSRAFTTQSGLAYTDGARVRASSAAGTTNWMEGLATYSGTTLTVTVTKTNGSGTHADWNLNVVGEPGAGDLTATNNLSDVADAATARANLGAAEIGVGLGLSNVSLAASAAAGALTIALKDASGNDATANSPIGLNFRDPNGTTGPLTALLITSAQSLVVPSGATLGTTSSTAFRLWVVGFNDGGTFRLGVINCFGSGGIKPLYESDPAASTAIDASSDSAGTFYTGAAVTTKSYRILGFVEWNSSGLTAGTWTTTNLTRVRTLGVGMKKPGDVVQTVSASNLTGATGISSTSFGAVSNTAFPAISPSSAANFIKYHIAAQATVSNVTSINTSVTAQASRSTTLIGGTATGSSPSAGGGTGWQGCLSFAGCDFPNTTSSTTYQLQAKAAGSGASVGVFNVSGAIDEIMG